MEAAAHMVVETPDDVEDGEISDSEYTPLPRPSSLLPSSSAASTAVSATRAIAPPISSDEHDSSESDSDSDAPRLPKVPRLRNLARPRKPSVPAKYTVWCQDIQEAALNEQLLNCDVELKYDKSRDVESYDYRVSERIPSPLFEPSPEDRNKRRHGDLRQRLGRQRHDSDDSDDGVGRPKARHLTELKVTEASSEQEVAVDIANKLCEEKESLVRLTVKVLGVVRCIQLFNKVRDIEADGGMMILNGARRRTPGGVFFYLLRTEDDISREQHDAIFAQDEKAVTYRKRKERQRKRMVNAAKLRVAEADRLEAELPALLSRAEQMAQRLGEQEEESDAEDGDEPDEPEACGSNPPPSPALDHQEEVVNIRPVTAYNTDDFLDVVGDDYDMF